jgi:hypothetical protein
MPFDPRRPFHPDFDLSEDQSRYAAELQAATIRASAEQSIALENAQAAALAAVVAPAAATPAAVAPTVAAAIGALIAAVGAAKT